jgi:hypothetical protein
MDSNSLIKGKIPTFLTALGWLLVIIGYINMPLGFDGCCIAGFVILLLGFISDIVLVKMMRPQNEGLLPNHQTDFYIQNNMSQVINAKPAINIIFIIACIIDLLWQIFARTAGWWNYLDNAEAIVYLFFLSIASIFTLLAVASCLALSKANYFATDLKPVAKISYAAIALGGAINAGGAILIIFMVANRSYVNIDFYALFLSGNIFIGLGFFGRLAFNEVNY